MIRVFYSADATDVTGGEAIADANTSDATGNESAADAETNKMSVAEPAATAATGAQAGEELADDAETENAAEDGTAEDAATKSGKGYTPEKDADMKTLVDRIVASWKLYPAITLAWTTQADTEALAATFSEELGQRKSIGGDRPSITSTLVDYNKTIDLGVTEVKVYIEKSFKKNNAKPQFPRYGIEKVNGTYILPRDQSQRLLNMDLMIAAIAKDGFGSEEYGTAFWTDMKKKYGEAMLEASSNDGSVSGKVSGKSVARRQLVKIMTALRFVLKGNYPDTYQAVYREWGWRKQS